MVLENFPLVIINAFLIFHKALLYLRNNQLNFSKQFNRNIKVKLKTKKTLVDKITLDDLDPCDIELKWEILF